MELTFYMPVLIGYLVCLLYAEVYNFVLSLGRKPEKTRNQGDIDESQKKKVKFIVFLGLWAFSVLSVNFTNEMNNFISNPTKHDYSCNPAISIIWVINTSII